ncbi:hypothetical protein B0T16DRAFT_459152 [Cercophora newfieldiana]|uniref:F-box domain-containing protein n=1 Tax=Cercophora newfieldiana TaxID=92897 RepID=A0AA39Y143_9PEZI|nr:hypothetical protein B0T16DRAFT_459152 [Cercophora newfieldiana]
MPALPNLPIEILETILEALCSPDYAWDGGDLATPSQTLVSLSQSCQVLHDLTAQHLYRHPEPNNWLLTRTLITRPDLAQLVRRLWLEHDYDDSDIPPEVSDFYVRRIDEGNTASNTDTEYYHLDLIKQEGLGGAPSDVISSLCPNLEEFSCNNVLSGTPYFWTPNSMMKLKTVTLCNEPCDRIGAGLEDFEPLLFAAPNIEEIQFQLRLFPRDNCSVASPEAG